MLQVTFTMTLIAFGQVIVNAPPPRPAAAQAMGGLMGFLGFAEVSEVSEV
jgi:hypothetical protein